MLDAWKRTSLSEILRFRVQLSSGKCKSDILVCHIYSSSAIPIPNSLSLQVNTMFFALTASTASSACYLWIKLCSFCLLKHCQLQSFWNQTLAGTAVGEAGHLSTTWLAHPSHRNGRGRKNPTDSSTRHTCLGRPTENTYLQHLGAIFMQLLVWLSLHFMMEQLNREPNSPLLKCQLC